MRGAAAVNAERLKKGLSLLDSQIIELAEESWAEGDDGVGAKEAKVSSSNRRQQLLGTLLRPPRSAVSHLCPSLVRQRKESSFIEETGKRWGAEGPYVIGLTGTMGSGKSHASEFLGSLGAQLIDADRLGHEAYRKGTQCFQQ